MKNLYDVLIVGAGASGSVCAIRCKQRGYNVALIDANYFPCKKLLVTGNGRCNLTNLNILEESYNCNIDKFLSRFSVEDCLRLFNGIGLEVYGDEEGRVYPISNMAKSVVDCLNYKINSLKIPVYSQEKVIRIFKEKDLFKIVSEKNEFFAKSVVVAVGNISEELCSEFNIKFNKFMPSLVALKTVEKTSSLAGVRVSNVKLSANINGKTFNECGEVLFKDGGLSGIVVFNLSAYLARTGSYDAYVSIDLLPKISNEELLDKIKNRVSKFELIKDIFVGMFANAVSSEIFSRCKIDLTKKTISLKESEMLKLCNCIKNFKFKINGCYENNQVVSGGVSLNDLDDNMQSKKNAGLYFCGEVCDVDGLCGGYNLQWAWTSGYIVGDSI